MGATRKRRVNDPPLPQRLVVVPSVEPPGAEALPTRIPINEEPPPANVLPFRHTAPTLPEVPLDLPTYTRPRLANPVEPAAPIELPTRQRRTQPRDMVADNEAYLRDLQSMPIEKLSKKKAALKGLLQGISMAAQGGPGAMAGGGIAGAIVGLAAPGRVAQMERDQEIHRASGRLDTEIAREAKMGTIEAQREVMAQRRKAPEIAKAKAEEQERDNLRQLYNSQPYFDPDKNPEHRTIRDRAAVLGMSLPKRDEKDTWSLEWKNGQLKRVSRRTGEVTSVVEDGKPFIDQTKVPVVEDGLTVTPGQALGARATRENRDYTRSRNVTLDMRHGTERAENITREETQKQQARREKAAGIAGEVATANAAAGQWQNLANKTTDKALKDYYESLIIGEKQKGIAKALELSQGYGDIYEAGPGEDGWAYVKPKAAPPAPPVSLPTRTTKGKGGVRPKVSRQKLAGLLGVQ